MRSSLLAAGAAAAWGLPGLAPLMPAVSRVLGIPRRLAGAGVALTFDDGPHPEGTPAVLEVLERFAAVFAGEDADVEQAVVGNGVRQDREAGGRIP